MYEQDFVPVFKPTADELKKDPVDWNASTRTCTMIGGYNIQVMTSVVGFENNLQKYVVGAKISPIKETWTYRQDGATKQSFSHLSFISFHNYFTEA